MSTDYSILAMTQWGVSVLYPNQGDQHEIQRITYDALSYYAFNGTLIVALVMGVVAPILGFVAVKTALWWFLIPMVLRQGIFRVLVPMESVGESEKDRCSYLLCRLFGSLFPEPANDQKVLERYGFQTSCGWKIVSRSFLNFEIRSPLPPRTNLAAPARGPAAASAADDKKS